MTYLVVALLHGCQLLSHSDLNALLRFNEMIQLQVLITDERFGSSFRELVVPERLTVTLQRRERVGHVKAAILSLSVELFRLLRLS